MLRNIRLLYIHNFLVDFRFQEAFLPIYFAQITGSYTAAMAVFASATITSAIMDIPTGILSDRMGRKFTLIVSSIFLTMGISFYALATGKTALFIGGILCGLSECMFNGNNNALLYETLKNAGQESRFSHYQGRASSMFQIGLGLSALAAGFLTKTHELHYIFMLGIVPQIMATIVGFFFEEPKTHIKAKNESLKHLKTSCIKIAKNPRLLLLIIGQAISYSDEAVFKFQTAFFNTLWPTWALGFYRALNHVFGFLGFWLAGRILGKVKAIHALIFRDSYWVISQSIGIWLSNIFTPFFFLSGAIFFGPGVVGRDQLLQKEFTDEQRATMGSIASFACSIVYAFVALCIGIISDHFGLAAGVLFGVLFCGLSIPFYIQVFRRSL